MMKILVTGFEPFGGSTINPSEQVVRRLREITFPGLDLDTAVLPVERTGAGLALVNAIEHAAPQAVLCLGEASSRPVISVERIAVNLMDYRIPDNQGNQVADLPVIAGGPAAYFATLPVRKILEKILQVGAPAELSLSAGSFLCNQVMYEALHYLTQHQLAIRAGFIHMPSLPQQIAQSDQRIPSMGLETALQAIVAALAAIVET
jgi:pyroglutamyl-peptidase